MQYSLPVHIVLVVFKRHRVTDYLKAIVNASVRFNVDMLTVSVADLFKSACIIIIFTAAVYFKLNTEITLSIAVKNRLRLITVLFYLIIKIIIAAVAVRVISSPVYVVVMDDSVAAFTAMIIVIVTSLAKCNVVVLY